MADNKKVSQCETCAYWDWDDEWDDYICSVNAEQDDVSSFFGSNRGCPYYSYWDEYKVVQKQN